MLIGIARSFAVEYELDPNYGGAWLYGKLCYWIGGARIGNYSLGTSLRDVLLQMKFLVSDSGKRDGGCLCSTDFMKAYEAIDSAIYGAQNPNPGFDSPASPARFDIRIPVDVFDNWKIYLMDCASSSVILFQNDLEKGLRNFPLAAGEFDSVISQFYNDLGRLYEQETS